MNKTNPIQIVKTRGLRDVFFKEGGGGNPIPDWANDDTIRTNAASLRESFASFEDEFVRREASNNNLPVLFVATLNEHATAKSYRVNVRAVFDNKRRNIIGVQDTNKLLVKIDNRDELHRLGQSVKEDQLLSLKKDEKLGIAAVCGIDLFSPFLDDDIEAGLVKVRLADYLDAAWNAQAESLFMSECAMNNIPVRKVEYASDLHIYCADIKSREEINSIAAMDSVISVKRMPYIDLSISPEPFNTTLEVKDPVQNEEYPNVGLLDSGISSIPHLKNWLNGQNQNIAGFEDGDIDNRHGTAVAGILNYGDDLQGKSWTGCSPMKITSCIVNTREDLVRVYESEMIEHIRSAVRNNPDIKVWNLSQGSTTEVSDSSFSDFAVALDDLQKECNVLICKSAGNIDPGKPLETRICQGADSVRSLVVASAAHEFLREGDAEPGQRSPFSRIGPGPEFLTKPDIAHYGGNTFAKLCSFTETGYQCSGVSGTSFSTPRITALAANLAHCLNREFDPLLIKALLIHNASYPNILDKNSETLLKELGHGIPSDLNSILNNDDDEFTMIWQPDLTCDVQIQDIPFPESLVDESGHYYGEITVTVVTDPILKHTEGNEYCQSDVEVLLQTNDGTQYWKLGDENTPRLYKNSNRQIDPQNMLAKSIYSKRVKKALNMEERTLIEAAQKYQPIKKYHVNLENLTRANTRYAESGRKWCLSIKALLRDAAEQDRKYDGVENSVRAVVVITIKDPRKQGVAYNECYRHLDLASFEHSDIILHQDIRVNNEL